MTDTETIKDRLLVFINYKELSKAEFERKCNLSNGYINSMRKGLGLEKIDNVLRTFPELNREWLLYGQGEMIKATGENVINSIGDHNSNTVNGAGNSTTLDKAMDEIAAQRRLTEKSQQQIDRLLTIIESMSNK